MLSEISRKKEKKKVEKKGSQAYDISAYCSELLDSKRKCNQ